jgi:threonine/homoserine/homoserine lactone efflux protein
LVGFGLFHLVAVVGPGPSLIVVTQTSISLSRRAGIFNALGFGVGSVIWAVAAIFGLSLVFTAFPWIYVFVKTAGALYLIYLGVMLLLSKGMSEIADRAVSSFLKGLIIQISNPKVVIFMGSIMTTLLPKDPSSEMLIWVVAIIFINEFLWYSLVASVFSIATLRNAYLKVAKTVDRLAGMFLGGLGLRILAQ